jgi:hypothetical protein
MPSISILHAECPGFKPGTTNAALAAWLNSIPANSEYIPCPEFIRADGTPMPIDQLRTQFNQLKARGYITRSRVDASSNYKLHIKLESTSPVESPNNGQPNNAQLETRIANMEAQLDVLVANNAQLLQGMTAIYNLLNAQGANAQEPQHDAPAPINNAMKIESLIARRKELRAEIGVETHFAQHPKEQQEALLAEYTANRHALLALGLGNYEILSRTANN